MTEARNLQTLKVSDLTSHGNVRRKVGDVRELAYSIDRVGILNPLTVRQNGDGFELIAGHRRLAAAEKLGLDTVPAYVLDEGEVAGDRVALQLIENLQREDLDALEEADALAELVELVGSQKAAAEAIGRSAAHVSKRLKVRQLPDEAREAIDSGELSLEDAFELTKIDTAAGVRKALNGLTGNGSKWELQRQVERTERDKESRKAARDVARQDHRQGVEVVAVPDIGKSWKSLEGWDGLPVDQDAHEGEPCHRLVVGYQTTWAEAPSEVFYCAEPERHDPETGESDVKTFSTARETEAAERQEAEAQRRARLEAEAAARDAEAITIASGVTDRNLALKVLARFVLDQAEEPERYLAALGAKGLPEAPETASWEDRDGWKAYQEALAEAIDGQPIATLYRAAVLFAVTMTTHHHYPHLREEPKAQALAELLEIDPFDPDAVEVDDQERN
jgi:ParB family chromosome partitioning protein